jgi:membrane protein DedA with SNARE-associated domain
LVSTYLIANHSLSWKEFLTIAPAALLIAENFVYLNGRIFRNSRFGWRLNRKIKENKYFQFYLFYLKKNLTQFLVVSKFLPATNLIFIFLTGWAKTKWDQFIKSYLASLFIWFSIITAISYSFASGLYVLKSKKIFTQIEIIIAVIILLIIGSEIFAKRLIKKFMSIYEKTTEINEDSKSKNQEENNIA